ncbi:hypothetical protein HAHE_23690 [Haloferula helveola]|uniref:HEAT repeat domain-containing protein n=1 Tax=Haloferula helveola TaxID=490095 RepID=A0ABM7RMS5_9BACT|nr:hypothetical protein HAHE_23690 [Haloferula helveola]
MDEKTRERVDQLQDSKAKKRELAAKALRKMGNPEAGPFLQAALEKERKDRRTWSSQYHMILALGFCEARQALPLLREMAGEDHPATILYSGLGDGDDPLGSES